MVLMVLIFVKYLQNKSLFKTIKENHLVAR